MINKEKYEKVLTFERNNPVELFVVDGIHTWPLLRNALCWNFLPKESPQKRTLFRQFVSQLILMIRQAIFKIQAIFLLRNFDVCILTTSQRKVVRNKKVFSIYADPILDLLKLFKKRTLVLEYGNKTSSSRALFVNIDILLKTSWAIQSGFKSNMYLEPEWGPKIRKLCFEVLGRSVEWIEIANLILNFRTKSTAIEKLLVKSNVRFLFVVCWFDLVCMAATLAAKKLGIKSIEMQHGFQGPFHPAYSSWFKTSTVGYEMIPDCFWTWGEKFSAELKASNPTFVAQSSIISGGNLLLNQWRNESTIPAVRSQGNRILIVLQGEDPPGMVIDAIKKLDEHKTFIFRFHPARSEALRKRDVAIIGSSLRNHLVEFEFPEVSALYSSIERSDLLITEGSVAALEALAFGIKTIITGNGDLAKQALIDYGDYIKEGQMECARDANELVDMLKGSNLSLPINFDPSYIFSDQLTSKQALKEILNDEIHSVIQR